MADSHPTLAQRLRAMRRAVSSVLLASFVLSPYGVLAAGPLADSAAPSNQRPQVSTAGSVPVVNIAVPGSNGISHNKYERFDVPTQGAVLNNSPTAVTSTLAGALSGNPNLTTGSARVILNEVTSNQPSSLLGQLEVVGPAARVVVANPNGITCDGCGFINTPHVQLAAARPFFEADKLRFELGAGRIDIGPLGLKALATRLDFIAGQIATAGPLESRDAINMVAGGEASIDDELITRRNGPRWTSSDTFNPNYRPMAIDIGQSVTAGSVRLILDSQTERQIRIRSPIRADEDVIIASRGKIDVAAQIAAGRDIGIANRGGDLGMGNGDTSDVPVLDAGRDVQILSFQGGGSYVRAGRNIDVGIGQEALIGYSDYAGGGFSKLEAGNDLRLITGRGLVMPFGIGRATVGRDLVAGPFGMTLMPGLQNTIGAAQLGLGQVWDPYRLGPQPDWEMLSGHGGGGGAFRGGIGTNGTITVGRDAKLSYHSGAPLYARNVELWVFGVDFGRIVASEDIVVKGIGGSLPVDRVVVSGSVAAGRDIRFESGYGTGRTPFWASLIIPFDAHAERDVVIDSPNGLGNLANVSAGANIRANLAGRLFNLGTLSAGGSLAIASGALDNRGVISANQIEAIVSGSFSNKGIVRSTSDVNFEAGEFVNSPHFTTTHQSSDRALYPGCATGNIGTCTADVESAIGEARILAGRDIVIDAPKVHNIGGALIAARNIDIATNDFLNQDREPVANWQSTYTNIDGLLVTKQGTTAGTTVLTTIPGVIQAGGLFVARQWPRHPRPPVDDTDGGSDDGGDPVGDDVGDPGSGGGTTSDSGSGSDSGNGSGTGSGGDDGSGSGSGSDPGTGTGTGAGSGSGAGTGSGTGSGAGTGTGAGSGSGGTQPPVVIVPRPVTTPSVVTPPVVARPRVAIPPAAVTPPPASTPTAPTNPPSRFVNTGVIQAGGIVIHADEIRNGFDPVTDYYRRTDPPSLPPATVALAAPLAQASAPAWAPADTAGGAPVRKLLPAGLAGTLPFALDAPAEQAALRQALQQNTGRSIILPAALSGSDGLDAETRQRAALQANAVAFALSQGIALGTPLSEAQIAQLDTPMLWYVEQGGQLVPQLVLPEADRARLAKLPGGLLQGEALVALSADKITNTGYILSGGTLGIDATQLSNIKRSAYYYDEQKVDGGKLIVEGDQVQPGGFMQALRWSLGAQEVDSRSGEFRVAGPDETATITASQAFAADIATALGEDFHYSEATDNLEARVIADKKKSGLSGLIGVVVAVVVAFVATPAVSAWIAGAAEAAGASVAAGSAWAAGTATASAGFANVAATSFVTGTLSSAAGQLAGTGKLDLNAALRNGAVSGLTAGLTNAAVGGSSADSLAGLSNQSGTLQPVAGAAQPDWADQLLGIGARSVVSAGIQNAINGTSFEAALREALVGDLAALGANQIGSAKLDSVPHALSHAALGAIAAELTGKDAAAGAIGALTSALAAQPIDDALGLTGEARKSAVTALAMLSGGTIAEALGYDALTAEGAALNEVTNNYLKHSEIVEKERRKASECVPSDSACRKGIESTYAALSQQRDLLHERCADAQSCRAVRLEIEQDMAALAQRARELESRSYSPAALTAIEKNEAIQVAINLNDAAKSYEQVWRQFRQVSSYGQWTETEKNRTLADALLAVGGLGATMAFGSASPIGRPLSKSPDTAVNDVRRSDLYATRILQQGENSFDGLGDFATSPWLNDPRTGVRAHIEDFRGGGSYLIPQSAYENWVAGKELVGRADGQFMTTKSAMDLLLAQANGDLGLVKQRLGVPADQWNEPLVRVDVMNPLLHNARLPSGLNSGANFRFQWGGYTSGGLPEIVTSPIPRTDVRATLIP